jgi:type II secretion system protein F
MPDFSYEAVDRAGKPAGGTIAARDASDAAVKVRALGVYPTRIDVARGKPAAKSRNGAENTTQAEKRNAATQANSGFGKRVTRMQLLLFTREMSDLLDAGLPMDRAFSVLIEQTESLAFRTMLSAMQGDIRAGLPLSDALAKFPREFPPLYYNMVRAGEVSGQLPGVMIRLADFMEKEQVRRSQIISALTYPAVLVGVAVLSLAFLLTFAIPKLAGVFKGMGAALPMPTQILISLSSFIGHFWWALLLGLAAGWYGFRLWTNTLAGRQTYDAFRLRLPVVGKLIQKAISARLVRTLGTLLGGGVPILEAMDISASALGNVVASEALLETRGGVRQGETLHAAMERSTVFLPVVRHMTAVGEETGRLPAMLIRTADTLDFEVDSAMRRLTSLVEPLVVLFMGVFVGFVVMSILLPIFQINTLVK